MDLISVRDERARLVAAPLTAKPVYLVPDPALLLPEAPRKAAVDLLRAHGIPVGERPIVGVSLRRWFHQTGAVIPHKYAVKYRLRKISGQRRCKQMIQLVAEVLDRIVAEDNASIVFMPTYNVSHEADDDICRQVMARMQSKQSYLLRIPDPVLYKAVCGRLDVMFGGRMHPAILAAAAGTNIVGLSYNQKFFGFFELMEMSDSVMDVQEFVIGQRKETLYRMLKDALHHPSEIKVSAHRLGEAIQQFNFEYISDL